MKILVTGASGYLGSNFIKTFQEQHSFETFSLQKNSIESIDFDAILTIIHSAGLVHQKIEQSYQHYYDINVKYSVDLAKRAKEQGVKHFIFISTIAVYGEESLLITENSLTTPITSYGKSKLEAEKQLLALQSDDFVVSIIRPPMIYGHNAPGNIASLIKIIQKVPLLPFGGINNQRSFVYIGNLVALINQIVELKAKGIFLSADSHPISTTTLIQLLAKALNKNLWLIRIPLFLTLLKKIKPKIYSRLYNDLAIDNKETIKRLNFHSPYTVEEGIELTIKNQQKLP